MKEFLFKDRDGQTPIHPDWQKQLIPTGIQTPGELDEHEEQNIALGLSWLEKQEVDGTDLSFWKAVHGKLFCDVWKWAGKIRTIELQNEEFLRLKHVQSALKELEGNLRFWLKDASMDRAEVAARFHERMLTIHPFPNGNGRLTRILTSYLAKRHGLPTCTWGAQEPNAAARRAAYVEAIRLARLNGDFKPLRAYLSS